MIETLEVLMAKQDSPVRLNSLLVSQAQAAADTFHRKLPEQVNYWAELGRLVESKLSHKEISLFLSGLASVSVQLPQKVRSAAKQSNESVDLISMAMKAQSKAQTKKAREFIQKKTSILYQASTVHAGLIEKVSADGKLIAVGQFKNGIFKKVRVKRDAG